MRAGLLLKLPLLFLLLGASTVQASCSRPLRFYVDLERPSAWLETQHRLGLDEPESRLRGMDVEIVDALARQVGCLIAWQTEQMSGRRILRSLEQGQLDGMFRASKTPEREAYAWFSEPYRQEVIGLFTRRDFKLPPLASLQAAFDRSLWMIGPDSGFYGEAYTRLEPLWRQSGRITHYKQATQGTHLLFAEPKRGDVLLVDADVFYAQLDDARRARVLPATDALRITPTHLMFSKKTVSNAQVLAFNAAILNLQKNGQLAAIEARHRPPELLAQIKRGGRLD